MYANILLLLRRNIYTYIHTFLHIYIYRTGICGSPLPYYSATKRKVFCFVLAAGICACIASGNSLLNYSVVDNTVSADDLLCGCY